MSKQHPLEFRPYRDYVESEQQVNVFMAFTNAAYGVTQLLLVERPQAPLPPIVMKDLRSQEERGSYCEADVEIDVELACEWISVAAYAERDGRDIAFIINLSENGDLGPVEHDSTGQAFLIWPPSMASAPRDQLPTLGKKSFRVAKSIRATYAIELDPLDTDHRESTRDTLLRLAHSQGEPDMVAERTGSMLLRSGYLLQWILFEVFLRETVIELFRRHPAKLSSNKKTITYEELVARSSQMESLEDLTDYLVELELQTMRAGGRSVHGIIEFLRNEFRFSHDPFEAKYYLSGEKRAASYPALIAVKRKRNALVHETNLDPTETSLKSRGDTQHVSETDYEEARLILRSIAHSIGRSIATGKYQPEGKNPNARAG